MRVAAPPHPTAPAVDTAENRELADLLTRTVVATPRLELPTLIANLERAKAEAFARLATPEPIAPAARELVDAAEMARRCGLTEFGVRDRARRGVIPCVHTGRRQVRFDPVDVLEALRRGCSAQDTQS
jgi:hypothetical protein